MEGYFKFVRVFPRLISGGVLFFSLAYLVVGAETAGTWIILLYKSPVFTNVISGIFVISALFLGSTTGVFISDCVLATLGKIFVTILWRHPIDKVLKRLHLSGLICPINVLAIDFLKDNKEQLIEYYMLKSCASVVDAQNDLVDDHFRKVGDVIDKLLYSDSILDFTFSSMVTQEQELLMRLQNNITDIYLFIVAASSLLYSQLPLKVFVSEIRYVIFFVFISLLLVIPLVIERRMRLSRHMALTYLDVFTLGPGASVADRESSLG